MEIVNKQINDTKSTLPVLDNLANHHSELQEMYKNIHPDTVDVASYTAALIPFNGYYDLEIDTVKGGFFTIDTDMVMNVGATSPIFHISLIVSLDGITSYKYAFTGSNGTFKDNKLYLMTPESVGGATFDLTFERLGNSDGATASLSGHISVPNKSLHGLKGATYNNPIPFKEYIGSYHEKGKTTPVMEIIEGYKLKYDYNTSGSILSDVPSFTYNMNMYFFSFEKGTSQSRLIMGTSSNAGLVSNNLIVDKKTEKVISQRSVQTITSTGIVPSANSVNTNVKKLSDYSGYYALPSLAKGAFLSIEGVYTYKTGAAESTCDVKIGISTDGIHSKVFNFDATMTFEENKLTIISKANVNVPVVEIDFKRVYTAQGNFGSLVIIKGKIEGTKIDTSYTPFNPVPLTGFKGGNMTNTKNDIIIINSDTSISYNGSTITDFVYVPIMYILVWQKPVLLGLLKETVELSLGTDAGRGNTCIITTLIDKIPVDISVVCAIKADNSIN